ncbi:hypothetical protein ABMA27_007430 [Loxostege sticticalis]|uniref:Uncharacterized protein n=1 Tax=Loxostege sticticalis TaxID=481309 RepID=A0ABR3HFD6_LOXSC
MFIHFVITVYLRVRVPGEQLSYVFTGTIPPFEPIYTLNVTPDAPALEKQFTYLKVEYTNPVSPVVVTFDPRTFILKIHQKFPFFSLDIGVHGYSMPLN